jgi:hypothetical protein
MLNSLIAFVIVGCVSTIIFLVMSHFAIINDWYMNEQRSMRWFWSIWTASLMTGIGAQLTAITTTFSIENMSQYAFFAFLPLIIGGTIIAGYIAFILIHMEVIKRICARNE